MNFPELERITIDPQVMGGKPCIRGIRITVGTITGLRQAMLDAVSAWRAEEYDVPLKAS